MSEQANSKLRELTNDYYHGLLGWEGYRSARAALLDTLVLGAQAVASQAVATQSAEIPALTTTESAEATQPAEDPTERISRPRPAARTKSSERKPTPEAAAAPAPAATTDGMPKWLLPAVGGAIALLIVVWLLWPSSSEVSAPMAQTPPPAMPREAAAPLPEAQPSAARTLVDEFIARPVWDEGSVASFLFGWDELTDDERDDARVADWFPGFVAALRERALEERALGAEAYRDGRTFIEVFAGELDIDLGLEPLTRVGAVIENPPEPDDDVTPEADASTEVAVDETSAKEASAKEASAKEASAEEASVEEASVEEASVEEASVEEASVEEASAQEAVTAAQTEPGVGDPQGVVAEAPAQPKPVTPPETKVVTPKSGSGRSCSAELLGTRRRLCQDDISAGGAGPVMAVIPGGTFMMGAGEGNEGAEQEVAAFAIGVWEVSVAEFQRFCEATDAACPENPWQEDSFPVVNVSWQDAFAYATWLTEQTGVFYRLPTEREWEYASRAGTNTLYPFGDEITDTDARFDAERPLPKEDKTTKRNKFLLWHMVGNVREWTTSGSQEGADVNRIVRGGSFDDEAEMLRVISRESISADHRDKETGFRVVREL